MIAGEQVQERRETPEIAMAIYIGLKTISEDENTKVYSFFRSCGEEYGTIGVDKSNMEIVLLTFSDEAASGFAFPRARRAIERCLKQGELPDQCAYRA